MLSSSCSDPFIRVIPSVHTWHLLPDVDYWKRIAVRPLDDPEYSNADSLNSKSFLNFMFLFVFEVKTWINNTLLMLIFLYSNLLFSAKSQDELFYLCVSQYSDLLPTPPNLPSRVYPQAFAASVIDSNWIKPAWCVVQTSPAWQRTPLWW